MKKKGLSQRGLGSYVPAHLNDSPFFVPIVTEEKLIKSMGEYHFESQVVSEQAYEIIRNSAVIK